VALVVARGVLPVTREFLGHQLEDLLGHNRRHTETGIHSSSGRRLQVTPEPTDVKGDLRFLAGTRWVQLP
jgi:hypothetical protein